MVDFKLQMVNFSIMTSNNQKMCTLVLITLLSVALAREGKTILRKVETNVVGKKLTSMNLFSSSHRKIIRKKIQVDPAVLD